MNSARVAVVAVGILLPYAARLPGTLTRGPDWLWSYFGGGLGATLFFAGLNAICWGSVLAASFSYRNPRSVWFPAVLGFSLPFYLHASVDLSSDPQAAIALVLIPLLSLPLIFVGWLVGRWFDGKMQTD
jgi:hypothetical protein